MLSGYILPVDWYVCCCDASGTNDRLDLRYRFWVVLGFSQAICCVYDPDGLNPQTYQVMLGVLHMRFVNYSG